MSKVRCAFCKDYFPKDEAISAGLVSFCTEDHMWKKQHQWDKGKNAPKDRDVDPDNDTKMPEGRWEEVMELDDGQCRICSSRYHLHVHHIRYRSEGIDHGVWNLIVLCDDHHDIVHKSKKKWQKTLLALLQWVRPEDDQEDANGAERA